MGQFNIDLEYSLKEGEDELLNNFYFRLFPQLKEIQIVQQIDLQKQGIDKILIFQNGKEIWIDEKKRRIAYPDILLEEYSNFDKKIWGWLGRTKKTDYIVYAVMPSKKVYLLPFLLLQKVWLKNYQNWLNQYGRLFAQNKDYRTSNIPVPTQILLEAIKKEMSVSLERQ